jgi:hypothetical protein
MTYPAKATLGCGPCQFAGRQSPQIEVYGQTLAECWEKATAKGWRREVVDGRNYYACPDCGRGIHEESEA